MTVARGVSSLPLAKARRLLCKSRKARARGGGPLVFTVLIYIYTRHVASNQPLLHSGENKRRRAQADCLPRDSSASMVLYTRGALVFQPVQVRFTAVQRWWNYCYIARNWLGWDGAIVIRLELEVKSWWWLLERSIYRAVRYQFVFFFSFLTKKTSTATTRTTTLTLYNTHITLAAKTPYACGVLTNDACVGVLRHATPNWRPPWRHTCRARRIFSLPSARVYILLRASVPVCILTRARAPLFYF